MLIPSPHSVTYLDHCLIRVITVKWYSIASLLLKRLLLWTMWDEKENCVKVKIITVFLIVHFIYKSRLHYLPWYKVVFWEMSLSQVQKSKFKTNNKPTMLKLTRLTKQETSKYFLDNRIYSHIFAHLQQA